MEAPPDILSYTARTSLRARYGRAFLLVLAALLLTGATIGGRAGWRRYQAYRVERQRQLNWRLIVAATQCDTSQVRQLLASGAQPDARSGRLPLHSHISTANWTPLISLVIGSVDLPTSASDQIATARLLIEARADVNLDDGYGSTALTHAVYNHHDDLALFLLEHGAKADIKTGIYIDGADAITPLHRAIGSPKVVKSLIDHGANVNAATSNGDTPLHWAAWYDDLESARLLLKAGANPNARDARGQTPLKCAQGSVSSKSARQILAANDDERKRLVEQMVKEGDAKNSMMELLRQYGGTE